MTVNRYYIFAFFAVFGWGLSTTLINLGLPYIKSQPFLAIRFIVATLIMTPYIFATRLQSVISLFKTRWIYLIALFETAGLLSQYIAQETVSAGLSGLLSMMFIVILPYLAYIFLSEKFHVYHALAIVLGFVGVFFIVTDGNLENLGSGSTIGILILLFTATAYAFYQLSTSKLTRFVNPEVDSIALFYTVMILISLISFTSAFTFSDFNDIKPDAWLWIALLAVFSTILAFTSYFEASKGIQANTLSIILVSQALIPFAIDILFLGVSYSVWIYLGGGIVVLAMLIVSRAPEGTRVKIINEIPNPVNS